MKSTHRSVGRGEKSFMCDLGPELLLRESRTRRAKTIHGMQKKAVIHVNIIRT